MTVSTNAGTAAILGDGFDFEVLASNDSGPPAVGLGRGAAATGRS